MNAKRCRAGWRRLRALAAVVVAALGASQTVASAQSLTAPAVKPAEPQVFPLAPAAVAPLPPVSLPPASLPAMSLPPASLPPAWSPPVLGRLSRPALVGVKRPCGDDASRPVVASAEEWQRLQSGQASPVEAAATKLKLDEAGVPARCAALRYLATMPCHHDPEAEAALIAALRGDRNEQVRLDAAQALATCCCCTPKTMAALLLAANGGGDDGNPTETSERVKAAANTALRHYAQRGFNVSLPDNLPPLAQQPLAEQPPAERPLAEQPLAEQPKESKTPAALQLTGYTSPLPIPAMAPSGPATAAELRFAEQAGTRPHVLATPRTGVPSRLPMIRLQPIGVIPPGSR